MNKIILLFTIALLSNLCCANDTQSFNIQAGIISINSEGKPYVSEETTRIPFRVGSIFGVIVNSSPSIEFECMASVRDPSDVVTVNNDDLIERLKNIDKIDATSKKIGAVTSITTKRMMCKGKFYNLMKLNDTDKPGKRTITLTINNTQYPAIIFDVLSEE